MALSHGLSTFHHRATSSSFLNSCGSHWNRLLRLFARSFSWPERYESRRNLLSRVKLPSRELSKFVDWSCRDLPYTRSLVGTDGINYTLLVLCWNPGRESKIHNHPCEGCFVLPMSGSLKETIYSVHPETDEIREEFATICKPGSISFMNDELGLHKIGNASSEIGAVSLHLYTPPFSSCKVPCRCRFLFESYLVHDTLTQILRRSCGQRAGPASSDGTRSVMLQIQIPRRSFIPRPFCFTSRSVRSLCRAQEGRLEAAGARGDDSDSDGWDLEYYI